MGKNSKVTNGAAVAVAPKGANGAASSQEAALDTLKEAQEKARQEMEERRVEALEALRKDLQDAKRIVTKHLDAVREAFTAPRDRDLIYSEMISVLNEELITPVRLALNHLREERAEVIRTARGLIALGFAEMARMVLEEKGYSLEDLKEPAKDGAGNNKSDNGNTKKYRVTFGTKCQTIRKNATELKRILDGKEIPFRVQERWNSLDPGDGFTETVYGQTLVMERVS